eukprot:CAMPEP_0204368606 /NCGR_PEP_ID=MMETSP0469-20131031/44320_1 /ASSEMBLY_ACC=CAM_ASM_000384 /TAXON_ID=2969 /ORGANISM="Oxyrrhis marina" /LENGTH=104 /DNA_ID=CAMNT_0051358195 /DNA_START=31 /DNA_END=345 /DNA_ORIENTATION=+
MTDANNVTLSELSEKAEQLQLARVRMRERAGETREKTRMLAEKLQSLEAALREGELQLTGVVEVASEAEQPDEPEEQTKSGVRRPPRLRFRRAYESRAAAGMTT